MPRTIRFSEESSPRNQENIQGCFGLFMLVIFPLTFFATPLAITLCVVGMGYWFIRHCYFVIIRDIFFVGNRKQRALNLAITPENTLNAIYNSQLKQIGGQTSPDLPNLYEQKSVSNYAVHIPNDAFYGKPLKTTCARRERVPANDFIERFMRPLVSYAIVSSGNDDYHAVKAADGGIYLVTLREFSNAHVVKTYIRWEINADRHSVHLRARGAFAYYSNSWLYDTDGSAEAFEDDLFSGVFEVVKEAYAQVTPLFHQMALEEVLKQAILYLETKTFAPVWNVVGSSYQGYPQGQPNWNVAGSAGSNLPTDWRAQQQPREPGTPPLDGAQSQRASEGIKVY